MRALFASTSGLGHVQPMLPLSVELRTRGHEVRWATAADGLDGPRALGFPTFTVGATLAERHAEFQRRWPEAAELQGPELPPFMFPRYFGEVGARAALPGLRDAVEEWPPDLVIHDTAELASPIVAAGLGVPNACHSFGPVLPADRLESAMPFVAPLWDEYGLEPPPYAGCYEYLYLDIYPPSMQSGDLSRLGEIQRRRPASQDATPDEHLPERVADAVETTDPLLYLTFGTVFTTDPTFEAAVEALGDLDASVVVTVGPAGDPTRFDPVPRNVMVERYVPQSLLLPHCDVVVSHAGSGTVLATLALGIPQVCVPQAADQFLNAAACEAAGAGLSLLGEAADREGIRAAAERMITDGSFRERAGVVAEEIAAMPSLAVACPRLEALVAA